MSFVYKLQERIDTVSAPMFEEDVLKKIEEQGSVELDASKLSYISSAGLRVFIEIVHKQGGLRIFNVSQEVYEVLEMTALTEMFTVEKA